MKPDAHYCIHKGPPVVPVLHSVYYIPNLFPKIQSNITLQSTPSLSTGLYPSGFRPRFFIYFTSLHLDFIKYKLQSSNYATSPYLPSLPFSALLELDQYLEICIFSAIQQQKQPGTNGSAVCTSVCLTSLTPSTFNGAQKWFFLLLKTL
jgi:hypothetical protein